MSASVISDVDTSPILEAGEQVFDLVPLAIEHWIVAVLNTVAGMGWNARRDAALDQASAESGRAVGAIGKQMTGWRQPLKQHGGGLVIVGLSLGQIEQERTAFAVANHLQLGGQSASTAPDTSG